MFMYICMYIDVHTYVYMVTTPQPSTCQSSCATWYYLTSSTGLPHPQENATPYNPTVGLCLGS